MRNAPKIILMVAFLVGLRPEMAQASVIDQQQPILAEGTGFQTGLTDIAQTFTVGINGRLDSISIIAANVGTPLTLDLLKVSSGLPGAVIASSFSATTGNFIPITFDFSIDNIMVSIGDVLAFQPILVGVGGEVGQDLAYGTDPDPYSRGEMFYKQTPCVLPIVCPPPTGGNWVPFIQMAPGQDLTFADMTFATTVDPIPEPATLLLLGTGLFWARPDASAQSRITGATRCGLVTKPGVTSGLQS